MVEFGVTIPNAGPLATLPHLVGMARRAEALGFSSVWVTDHVVMPLESASAYPFSGDGKMTWAAENAWLDPFVALSWVGAQTARIGLGTSVLILPLRPTLLVAKMAASLDQLSAGRLLLGVGSGWLAEEFELLGQSFADRGARMTEALSLLRAAWAGGQVTFQGEHHSRLPFAMAPGPARGRRIPLLIGGHSDAALRRVALAGDGWQPTFQTPDQVRERLGVLDGFLSEAGRSRRDLRIMVRPGGKVPVTTAMVDAYVELGVDTVILDGLYRTADIDGCLAALEQCAAELGVHAGP